MIPSGGLREIAERHAGQGLQEHFEKFTQIFGMGFGLLVHLMQFSAPFPVTDLGFQGFKK